MTAIIREQSRVNKNWFFGYNDSAEDLADFKFVVDDLLEVFNQFAPIPLERQMAITIWDEDYPMYSGDHINIFLHPAGPSYWAQITYQLSHELCHFYLYEGIKIQNYKWFEETLCELSSLFFLKQMSKYWNASISLQKKSYHSAFESYFNSAILDVEKVSLTEAGKNSALASYLASNDVDRLKNRYFAMKLLPIFEKSSVLWKSVPDIATITKASDFRHFLLEWERIANPEAKKSIQKIVHQFD